MNEEKVIKKQEIKAGEQQQMPEAIEVIDKICPISMQ